MDSEVAEFIQALQQISQALQPSGWTLFAAVATVCSAVGTMISAIATAVMVKEMRDTRAETFRPYIIIDYEEFEGSVYLSIRNIGQTIARNISVEIENPIKEAVYNKDIRESMFGDPLPSIAPGWYYRNYINEIGQMKPENGYIGRQEVKIKYNDSVGKSYEDSIILDLKLYDLKTYQKSLETKKSESLQSISKDINEIKKVITDEKPLEGQDALRYLLGR